MSLPNVVSIKDGLESLDKLYKTVNEIFKDDGNPKRQILVQITNNTDRKLQLAGAYLGAGVIPSKGGSVWQAPFTIDPKEVALIPVESAGWSAQSCFAYGFKLKKDDVQSAQAMFLLYAYNPKVGYNYAGWHNVSGNEFITQKEWGKAQQTDGQYPGNTLCEKATNGTGPDWQVEASHSPTAQYHFNEEWVMKRTATRETIEGKTDVSRLRIDFTFECSKNELEKISQSKQMKSLA